MNAYVRYITYCNHAILVSTVSHSQFPGLRLLVELYVAINAGGVLMRDIKSSKILTLTWCGNLVSTLHSEVLMPCFELTGI